MFTSYSPIPVIVGVSRASGGRDTVPMTRMVALWRAELGSADVERLVVHVCRRWRQYGSVEAYDLRRPRHPTHVARCP
jgi:hypothetical protein